MTISAKSLTSNEFKRIKNFGTSKELFGRYFVVRAFPACESDNLSYGIVISRKIANACKRNKIKRRLRHIISIYSQKTSQKVKIVIYTRKKAVDASFEELKESFLLLMKKVGN